MQFLKLRFSWDGHIIISFVFSLDKTFSFCTGSFRSELATIREICIEKLGLERAHITVKNCKELIFGKWTFVRMILPSKNIIKFNNFTNSIYETSHFMILHVHIHNIMHCCNAKQNNSIILLQLAVILPCAN